MAPTVAVQARDGRAHYHGVMRCASTWECAYCQTVLRIARAEEVRQVVEWHAIAHGRETVSLVTYTVRHGLGDDLRRIRRGLTQAYQQLQTGRVWKKWQERLGYVGYVRAVEVTHGKNGWHPHIHAVMLTAIPPPPEFTQWLADRWARIVARKLGENNAPSFDRGVDVRPCHAADYLQKLGLEITAPAKTARGSSRTPLEILAAAVEGDGDAVALYQAYARHMKGARMLTWSRDLKAAAGITDQTDEELIDGEDRPETTVCEIQGEAWDAIRDVPGVTARILKAAEDHGAEGVRTFILGLGKWPHWYDPLGSPAAQQQLEFDGRREGWYSVCDSRHLHR